MPDTKKRPPLLDPDTVLQLCKRFSGYDGAQKALADGGLKNPQTGRAFSKNAIVVAARKASGFAAWRRKRDVERSDVQEEFKRIAAKMIKTKLEKGIYRAK